MSKAEFTLSLVGQDVAIPVTVNEFPIHLDQGETVERSFKIQNPTDQQIIMDFSVVIEGPAAAKYTAELEHDQLGLLPGSTHPNSVYITAVDEILETDTATVRVIGDGQP